MEENLADLESAPRDGILQRSLNGSTGLSTPKEGEGMVRKRYQRGALVQIGDKWVLRWRTDYVDSDGVICRREKRATVGLVSDLQTKRTARRVADRLLDTLGLNAVDYRPGKSATLGEFAAVYESGVLTTMKPSACESYKSAYRCYIEPVLGDFRLDAIGAQASQRVVSVMVSAGRSRKTVVNALTVLASMLRAAYDWDYTATRLDWGRIRMPPKPPRVEQRFFTPTEAQAMIDAAPEPWNICIAFMAYLGLRCGEAVGVAWQHIDLDGRVLMVRQSNWRGHLLDVKSADSRRNLPLPGVLVDLLRGYWPHRRASSDGLLFPNLHGAPITSCYVRRDVLHPLRKRLGIPTGAFHALRHGHATAMFDSGMASPAVVKASMGHAHISTTMGYTHVVSDEQRKAVDRAAEAFQATRVKA